MMKRVVRFALAMATTVAACLVVSACASNGKPAHEEARAERPLEVPPELVLPEGDNVLTIPETQQQAVNLSALNRGRPQQQSAEVGLPALEGLRVAQEGSLRWLVVEAKPDGLWPRLQRFLEQAGLAVSHSDRQLGLLETDWLQSDASELDSLQAAFNSGTRHQYVIRLEPGPQSGEAEIYIHHRGLHQAVVGGDRQWLPQATQPHLEILLLKRLALFLGAEEEQVQRLEDRAAGTDLVLSGPDAPALTVDQPRERLWRRMGAALSRAGLTLTRQARAEGAYEAALPADSDSDLLRDVLAAGEPGQAVGIRLEAAGDATRVTVVDEAGGGLSDKLAERVLQRLQEVLG